MTQVKRQGCYLGGFPVDYFASCTLAIAHALKLGAALGLASPNRQTLACD